MERTLKARPGMMLAHAEDLRQLLLPRRAPQRSMYFFTGSRWVLVYPSHYDSPDTVTESYVISVLNKWGLSNGTGGPGFVIVQPGFGPERVLTFQQREPAAEPVTFNPPVARSSVCEDCECDMSDCENDDCGCVCEACGCGDYSNAY